MSAFPDWQKYAVKQKNDKTGCIPAAYEMMLRSVGALGINFATFQDDFDLDKALSWPPKNNFGSVALAVQAKYPTVEFKRKEFKTGAEKIAFIEKEIATASPLMVSIWMGEFDKTNQNWHTMTVVDTDADTLTLLNGVRDDGTHDTWKVKKSEVARIQDAYPGGNDVAYLAKY